MIDFKNLPENPDAYVEGLSKDDVLHTINAARQYLLDNPEESRPEFSRFTILLVRRARAAREGSGPKTAKAGKPPEQSLNDLLAGL